MLGSVCRLARGCVLAGGAALVVSLLSAGLSVLAQARVVPRGTLIMAGGGRLPRAAMRAFVAAAGGPEAPIVVVPTALPGDALRARLPVLRALRAAGARNVSVVHARIPAEIARPSFLEPIDRARGIWFTGGRSARLVDAYAGTVALDRFRAVLARGGVIGGSSAGASIQAGYLVRGDPFDIREIMAEGRERGFGFLEGVAVDPHFNQRGRHPDLSALRRRHPRLIGLGVDENTAILVRGATLTVLGRGCVAIYDGIHLGPERSDDLPREDFLELHPGNRYDLRARRRIAESTGE